MVQRHALPASNPERGTNLSGERAAPDDITVQRCSARSDRTHALYHVRYTGDKLDDDEAMKLLEAVADIKTRKLPGS